mgnify:CR=1 FL=1|jgi:hypothetical protein
MLGSIFSKIIGSQVSNAVSSSGGSTMAIAISSLILLLLVVLGLLIWFFCACHGWLVLVFPAFAAFPRWAFVLLMFMFTNRGTSSSK